MPQSQTMQASQSTVLKLDLRKSYGFAVYGIYVHKLQGVRTEYEYYYIEIAERSQGNLTVTARLP